MDESPTDLNASSLAYAEDLYQAYLTDPGAVPEAWRQAFERLGGAAAGPGSRAGRGPSFRRGTLFDPPGTASAAPMPSGGGTSDAELHQRLDRLVRNFRVRGHRVADLNPLGGPTIDVPELELGYYRITDADLGRAVLDTTFPDAKTVGDVYEALRATYTRSIGAQFMHIDSLDVRRWLQARMERTRNRLELSRATQLRILTKLSDAVIFEEFVQKKFVGAKSFSLEGSESLIPLLELALEKAGEQGVREVVLGMAHRGRLNVLANIMGKHPRTIFREFEDKDPEMHRGRGDVKYHLGYSNDWTTQAGHRLHLSLAFNPSHLEFVNAVAMGRVRAKQDRVGDVERTQGLGILIHGDAAFIGEGIVQETLNMSELPGYRVGGILHVIVNNQIGFTTGPEQGRSTTYASDVAKMLQSPVFHVNGEDPEAVAQVMEVAMDFRRTFQRDVVIDMYAYRRFGHNEGDEPAFTQPAMYADIRRRPNVREGYLERLLTLGEVTRDEADAIAEARREQLEQELSVARGDDFRPTYSAFEGLWKPYVGGPDADVPDAATAIEPSKAARLLRALGTVPEGFTPNPKLTRFLKGRREMASGDRDLDWSAGEALAFGSLVAEGVRVRLSGQDSERGTFSHRHSVLHDAETGARLPLFDAVAQGGGVFDVHNSPLSENGVLGFEYGYSLDWPDGLVLWEAQFGDFVNTAQVIIDQFIASGEDKWRRLSGLVLLLPHGFEGAGPEHSSARLERFLQMGAEDNLQVVVPSTPAQMFHLLRRQVRRPWRKPLVVFTPKSLLRHPKALSPLAAFTDGAFQTVLPDDTVDPDGVRKVLLCSGKVYYDLLAAREEQARDDVALVRVEQLYPLRQADVDAAIERYPAAAAVTWVQEEPENMGALRYLRVTWGDRVAGRPFAGVSRPASASPATGSASSHRIEQAELLRAALGERVPEEVVA
ncbi:MAG: 2-oxoglutarate dehydrogenase E1 component [Trueperaceae bacterium]|nr:2-oxoglutarate dehydrogenase E1 component [Trueperaceae bacterium]